VSQPGYLIRRLHTANRLRALHRTPGGEVIRLSRHEFVLCIRSRPGHPGRSLFRSRNSRSWRGRTRGSLLDFLWPNCGRGIRGRCCCWRRHDQGKDLFVLFLFPIVRAFPFRHRGFARLSRWRDKPRLLLSSSNVLVRSNGGSCFARIVVVAAAVVEASFISSSSAGGVAGATTFAAAAAVRAAICCAWSFFISSTAAHFAHSSCLRYMYCCCGPTTVPGRTMRMKAIASVAVKPNFQIR
jgi:hypothetical protein